MWKDGHLEYDEFLKEVYELLGFENETQERKDQFALQLLPITVERVTNCVLRNLDEEVALTEMEKISSDNPDFGDIEVLFALVDVIPGLKEVVIRNLNDLKDELESRIAMIDFVMDEAKREK